MLNGATDRGQRIFLIKCALFISAKKGKINPTIREIIKKTGILHFPSNVIGNFFLEASKDPMIIISSKFEPFTTNNKFNLDLDMIIEIKHEGESKFLEFIDARIEKVLERLRMEPINLSRMEEINAEQNKLIKLEKLMMFLRYHPIPFFTY